MSSASLAKKRRANLSQPIPNTPSQQFDSSNTSQVRNVPLTLPQVLQIIDSRLLKLEKVVKSQSEQPQMEAHMVKEKEDDTQLKELLVEYDERFQILATEIQDIKDIVLKLQSYTMDVNKTLLEERIEIMNMNNTAHSTNETIEMIERIQNDTPPERETAIVEDEEQVEIDSQLYNIGNVNDMSIEDMNQGDEMDNGNSDKKGKRKGRR
jgi:hypothetical protein